MSAAAGNSGLSIECHAGKPSKPWASSPARRAAGASEEHPQELLRVAIFQYRFQFLAHLHQKLLGLLCVIAGIR